MNMKTRRSELHRYFSVRLIQPHISSGNDSSDIKYATVPANSTNAFEYVVYSDAQTTNGNWEPFGHVHGNKVRLLGIPFPMVFPDYPLVRAICF